MADVLLPGCSVASARVSRVLLYLKFSERAECAHPVSLFKSREVPAFAGSDSYRMTFFFNKEIPAFAGIERRNPIINVVEFQPNFCLHIFGQ